MKGISFCLLLLIVLGWSSCRNASSEQVLRLQDSLLKVNTLLDSFEKANIISGGELDYWQDSRNFALLHKQGITEPATYLANDLSRHPELIPFKPTLGGQMQFGRITLIGEQWAVAHAEDGHIGGQIFLRYEIGSDQKIRWRVLDSRQTD